MNYLTVKLILFVLGTVGLQRIISDSLIMKPIREKLTTINSSIGKHLSCAQCMGFWSAFFVYLLLSHNMQLVVCTFAGSFICDITYKLLNRIK